MRQPPAARSLLIRISLFIYWDIKAYHLLAPPYICYSSYVGDFLVAFSFQGLNGLTAPNSAQTVYENVKSYQVSPSLIFPIF